MASQTRAMEVACKHCRKPISIFTLERPPAEFSVKCEQCGQRSFYEPADMSYPDDV
jgi:ribosomal protein S27E